MLKKNKKIIEIIILLLITIGGFSSLIINICGLWSTYPYNIIGWGSLILVVSESSIIGHYINLNNFIN